MKRIIKILPFFVLAVFFVLMLRITIPYFVFEDDTGFLRIKQWIIHNNLWKTAFYVHVITSCVCLFAGFTQFSSGLLAKKPKLHRTIGWTYIITVLLLSGPSGLIMSFYANGGPLSQIAFTTLSLLWIFFTLKAFLSAKAGDFSEHRKFMIRSYALTLSAVTLRAWKFAIAFALRPHPMDVYMIVAWLGWVPNLFLAEWYIRTGWYSARAYFSRLRA
jgi:uncharacterized membrane protein